MPGHTGSQGGELTAAHIPVVQHPLAGGDVGQVQVTDSAEAPVPMGVVVQGDTEHALEGPRGHSEAAALGLHLGVDGPASAGGQVDLLDKQTRQGSPPGDGGEVCLALVVLRIAGHLDHVAAAQAVDRPA